ncbi:hypothetical protein A9404_10300 [Halothiobacillus diazotrophicus]|uniref:Uncharacterized protein n=2 Tax=Halothiobacillus diazotrophicus TaxID=1860122 RepID=A0A191ZIN5_9GAMM|nr:hypothetical protein A9404_10300 [Halothiobacillus diazotrophicus]
MYLPFWNQFVTSENYAVNITPESWQSKFDIVTSFFALEHIPEPLTTAREIFQLLNDKGIFYGIVPYSFSNPADFIVIDHVNHFTKLSLHRLLALSGFKEILIDSECHRGALVFVAKKSGVSSREPDGRTNQELATNLANYWNTAGHKIIKEEQRNNSERSAIYGSGFYGSYIFSQLKKPEKIMHFIDASPYQQGKTVFNKPIISPDELPDHVDLIYVGLNPSIAHNTMLKLGWNEGHRFKLIYMDSIRK